MKSKSILILTLILLLLLLIWVLIAAIAKQHEVRYRITDIGAIGSIPPRDLNNKGQVVGARRANTPTGKPATAFVWDSTGGMVDLRVPGASHSIAASINHRGEVVGHFYDAGNAEFPFYWNPEAGPRMIGDEIGCGTLPTNLTHINDAEQILGSSLGTDNRYRPFFWSKATGMVHYSTPDSFYFQVGDLNNNGQVVGNMTINHRVFRPKLWSASTGMIDVETWNGTDIWVASINDEGRIFGSAPSKKGDIRFLEWTAQEGMRDIGKAPPFLELRDFNQSGHAVGYWSLDWQDGTRPAWFKAVRRTVYDWVGRKPHRKRAVLIEDGMLYYLNHLIEEDSGWFLKEATAINDRGQIVGLGLKDNEERAYLLTPIE